MVDFRKLISPRSQAEIKHRRQTVMRFQELPPRDMARELLDMSRALIDSDRFSSEPNWSYDERALYRVIPEIARRLDPEVELRDSEIPKDDERKDQVTWIHGQSLERLIHAARGIADNGAFSRANAPEDPNLTFIKEVLFDNNPCAFTIAADTISPGAFPDRATPDEREPLPGFYVVGQGESYDKVLKYADNRQEADRFFDAAVLDQEGTADCPDEILNAKNELHRSRFHHAADTILMQEADGTTLRSHDVRSSPEPDPAP